MFLLLSYSVIVKEPVLIGLAAVGLVVGAVVWLVGKRMEKAEK